MKQLIIVFAVCFTQSLVFGQGIISDIMVVETVSIDLSEVNEKRLTKYKETLEKETAAIENDLGTIDKRYKEEVSKFTEDFTKQLNEGEEKIINNLKRTTVSRVTSLTMTHRTDKKRRVQAFLNKMQVANRKLPVFLRQEYAAQVKVIGSKHLEMFNSDYEAHINTIRAFEDQEHLIITEGVESIATN